MDIYTLREQEESIEDLKLELRKISQDLLSAGDGDEVEGRVDMPERLLRVLKADVKRLAGNKEERPPLQASGVLGMLYRMIANTTKGSEPYCI